jgi:hypothetical protein
MTKIDVYSNGEVVIFSTTPKLARVKTSFEVYGVSRPTYNKSAARFMGLPDTWQYEGLNASENNHVVLTEALQWFWYTENVKRTPNMTEQEHWQAFNSLTADDRYITNFAGSTTCRVYPTGKNSDKPDMKYQTLLTANAIIEIVDTGKVWAGHTSFRVIDASKPFAEFTPGKHPYLWYTPYTSNRLMHENGWDETLEYTFPQFEEKPIVPLLMPNTDVAWIDSSLLVMM